MLSSLDVRSPKYLVGRPCRMAAPAWHLQQLACAFRRSVNRPVKLTVLLPKYILFDLPRRVARQVRHEQNTFGLLVSGKPALKRCEDILFSDRICAVCHHHCRDPLTKIRMRQADNSGLKDSWKSVDLEFHFFGIDVIAARNDEVLDASDNLDVAPPIDFAQISGYKIHSHETRFWFFPDCANSL